MTTADNAVTTPLLKSRRAAAKLARPPSIPKRRIAEPAVTKRAAVVLRRGMRPLEFRQVEEQLEGLRLVSLPVLSGQRRLPLTETPVCGLIVTGSDFEPSPVERAMIEEAVCHVHGAGGPVIALSDAAHLVLETLDLPPLQGDAVAGVLVHGGVQTLANAAQFEGAMKVLAGAPEVR